MDGASGSEDVWKIGGVPVSQVAQLATEKWSLLTGNAGKLTTHQGHFFWSGADSSIDREAGASAFVQYLNRVHQIAPSEPLRLVAHSHGCNVVKMASSSNALHPGIRIQRVVFLACPHFVAQSGNQQVFPYRLSPNRFGKILNLFSEADTVQTTLAEAFRGPFGYHVSDYLPTGAHRWDQDPTARAKYEDCKIPTVDQGTKAHTAMHGLVTGILAGFWLNCNRDVQFALRELGKTITSGLFPVPQGDYGE